MELFERISLVVSMSGMTKTKFAAQLGISQPFLSQLCNGTARPSDRTLSDICREFSVNEAWLRTGNGEMFRQETRDEQIASFIGDLMRDEPDSFRKAFVSALAELSYEDWKVLERIATAVAEKAAQSEEQKPAPKSNIVKMAGRDGSYQELELTDQQLADLKQRIDSLPDVPEDL